MSYTLYKIPKNRDHSGILKHKQMAAKYKLNLGRQISNRRSSHFPPSKLSHATLLESSSPSLLRHSKPPPRIKTLWAARSAQPWRRRVTSPRSSSSWPLLSLHLGRTRGPGAAGCWCCWTTWRCGPRTRPSSAPSRRAGSISTSASPTTPSSRSTATASTSTTASCSSHPRRRVSTSFPSLGEIRSAVFGGVIGARFDGAGED
jgi:hypothetical protein